MPIYVYKCESCGATKDVLQKLSDSPLTDCPACGAASFRKQLTSAGFQLKGSGWYATDFKGTGAPVAADKAEGSDSAGAKPAADSVAKPESTPTPAPAPAPAAASGGSNASAGQSV